MHTLSQAQSKRNLKALVAMIVAAYPGAVVSEGSITLLVKHEGRKLLSAITAGGPWSVQVTTDIAERFMLSLWKDKSFHSDWN